MSSSIFTPVYVRAQRSPQHNKALVHNTLVQVLSGNIPPCACGYSTGNDLSSGEGKKQEESLPSSDALDWDFGDGFCLMFS